MSSTRRQFLKGAAAAAGILAAPHFIPVSVLGRGTAQPPNDRIAVGCIGVGGMGTHNMRMFLNSPDVQVVAVCDVDRGSTNYPGGLFGREPAREEVERFYAEREGTGSYRGCASYGDFRELLARDDIDVVCVSTPDHWHALVSVAAANAGKDVYCEKPLANSVGEGRAICRAVAENGRILQTGSHERSTSSIRFACELVRNGRIGELRTIRVNLPCSDGHHVQAMAMTGLPPDEPIPDGFDYDMWLGHTPWVPYTKLRCHFWWRFILAYGGGEMTDRGAHIIDIAQLGAGMDATGPVEIEATGTHSTTSLYDAFMDYRFVNRYANGVEMIGTTDQPRGLRFVGTEGSIFIHIHGGALEADPPSLLDERIGDDEIQLGRSPGHHRNFLDCVRSRETPMAPAEVGHRTATICHLNNIAMLVGRPLRWDPDAEQIVGDPEANAMLTPRMRSPWHL